MSLFDTGATTTHVKAKDAAGLAGGENNMNGHKISNRKFMESSHVGRKGIIGN